MTSPTVAEQLSLVVTAVTAQELDIVKEILEPMDEAGVQAHLAEARRLMLSAWCNIDDPAAVIGMLGQPSGETPAQIARNIRSILAARSFIEGIDVPIVGPMRMSVPEPLDQITVTDREVLFAGIGLLARFARRYGADWWSTVIFETYHSGVTRYFRP